MVRIREGAFGSEHPLIARGLNNLCVVEARLGRAQEALEHCEQAMPLARAAFGEAHATWPTFLNSLASAQLAAKQLPQAKASFEAASGLRAKVVGPEHPSLGYDEAGLGEVALAGGHPKVAAVHFARALALWRQEPKQRVLQAEASFGLAKALWAFEPDRAHAALAEAQSLLEAARPAGHRQLAAVTAYGRVHAK